MKFVSSRELRIHPGAVWKILEQEKDLVITSNGRPIGVLTFAREENLEDVLGALRQGRAQAAAVAIRRAAVDRGLDGLTNKEIDEIIRKGRQASRKAVTGGRR